MRSAAISMLVLLAAAAPALGQAKPPPTTRPSAAPTQPAGPRTRSAEEMLNDMLRPKPGPEPVVPAAGTPGAGKPLQNPNDPPANDRTSGGGAVKPDAPAVTVLREGTFIVDRIGRLTRSADGSLAELSFEADGKALRDPPVVIIPNLKLMAMENAVSGANRDLRFRVSGIVTEYRGRNYIMLEKVVVVPDAAQQF